MPADVVLSNYYNTGADANIRSLANIEDSLAANKPAITQAMLNALLPTNAIETNYKTFYSLYLKNMNATFTSADSNNLLTLAKICPGIGGSIIYNARTLYNSIYTHDYQPFNDDCTPPPTFGFGIGNVIKLAQSDTAKLEVFEAEIYPNPNGGNFYIKSNAKKDLPLIVEIYTSAGKMVIKTECIKTRSDCQINVKLNAGIYIVKIINNETHEILNKKMEIFR
jgi:hypothetical protein